MSLYLLCTLSRAEKIRLASSTGLELVIATRVPWGRCAFVFSLSRARRKSRASIAEEVSCAVRLVCDP